MSSFQGAMMLAPLLWVLFTVSVTAQVESVQVYQKLLPNHQTLVVSRRAAVDVPPEKPLPLGYSYAKTDHIDDYDFHLVSDSLQKRPTTLWTHQVYSYKPNENLPHLPTDFQILDVALQGKLLLVVYKESNKTWGGWTFANVITQTTGPQKWEAMAYQDAKLVHDSDTQQVYITSATITGAVKDKTLLVSLKNVHSVLLFRLINGKWTKADK